MYRIGMNKFEQLGPQHSSPNLCNKWFLADLMFLFSFVFKFSNTFLHKTAETTCLKFSHLQHLNFGLLWRVLRTFKGKCRSIFPPRGLLLPSSPFLKQANAGSIKQPFCHWISIVQSWIAGSSGQITPYWHKLTCCWKFSTQVLKIQTPYRVLVPVLHLKKS